MPHLKIIIKKGKIPKQFVTNLKRSVFVCDLVKRIKDENIEEHPEYVDSLKATIQNISKDITEVLVENDAYITENDEANIKYELLKEYEVFYIDFEEFTERGDK